MAWFTHYYKPLYLTVAVKYVIFTWAYKLRAKFTQYIKSYCTIPYPRIMCDLSILISVGSLVEPWVAGMHNRVALKQSFQMYLSMMVTCFTEKLWEMKCLQVNLDKCWRETRSDDDQRWTNTGEGPNSHLYPDSALLSNHFFILLPPWKASCAVNCTKEWVGLLGSCILGDHTLVSSLLSSLRTKLLIPNLKLDAMFHAMVAEDLKNHLYTLF